MSMTGSLLIPGSSALIPSNSLTATALRFDLGDFVILFHFAGSDEVNDAFYVVRRTNALVLFVVVILLAHPKEAFLS